MQIARGYWRGHLGRMGGRGVIVAGMAETEGAGAAAELRGATLFQTLNVANENDRPRLVEAVLGRPGRVDVLVNNAGIVLFAGIAGVSAADFDRVCAVNVKGAFLGIQHIGRAMNAAGRVATVNIPSIDGLRGASGVAADVTSTWALCGLTKATALECGRRGARVNSLYPGCVGAGLGNPMDLRGPARNRDCERDPLQRIGRPGEIAAASLFLCSDEAFCICGAELAVDGGWSAGHYHVALPVAPASLAPAG